MFHIIRRHKPRFGQCRRIGQCVNGHIQNSAAFAPGSVFTTTVGPISRMLDFASSIPHPSGRGSDAYRVVVHGQTIKNALAIACPSTNRPEHHKDVLGVGHASWLSGPEALRFSGG